MTVRVLDLFAGAGGLSAGLKSSMLDVEIVAAVEMDAEAAATYDANEPEVIYCGTVDGWLREETVPEVDLVVGGPPCQGFSALGKQDAFDARNALWGEYARTLELARPKYFVMENVPQFLASAQFRQFERETSSTGQLRDYTFASAILNAADLGAPQARKRAIVIGHHRDLPDPGFPSQHVKKVKTVMDALAGVPVDVVDIDLPDRWTTFGGRTLRGAFESRELHLTRRYAQISLERFRAIPPRGNRFDIPEHLKAPCWRRHTTGSADVMGRLHWDRPSVTIRTEFYKPEKGRYLHPEKHRAITHYEAARLQGFADNFRWVGSKTSIGRQIGNAVPIPLGRSIGDQLAAALSGTG